MKDSEKIYKFSINADDGNNGDDGDDDRSFSL